MLFPGQASAAVSVNLVEGVMIGTLVKRTTRWPLLLILLAGVAAGQSSVPRRITSEVKDSDVARLADNVHPLTRIARDQGNVPAEMPLQRMSMFFNPSAAQQQALLQLLAEQQNPSSPNYHKWLTPEQYADRFGMSAADLAKVVAWLQARGFQNVEVARGRTSIQFDGNAAQAQSAFHTSIHRFVRDGETHYANVSSPSLPSAFAGTVTAITALNDFRPKPRLIAHLTSNISGNHFLVPGDVATIYNIKSLYDSGYNGSGQAIAVLGQTALTQTDDGTHADVDTFRSLSGLPPINLQQKNVDAVKYIADDVDEANLDIEWSGAIAPAATIYFVYSSNALFTSLPYAVNNNLAPVISVSYGTCEADFGNSDISTLVNTTQQANAQGQTVVVASGDAGAADCDTKLATQGLAVDVPAALQNVTSMGGTVFSSDSAASFTCNPPNSTTCTAADTQYWKGSNSLSDTSATAISYIPEAVWNSSTSSSLAAGGGGVSKKISKPAWQTGNGVPNDGQRDVPDISFSSSPDHDGYIICSKNSCNNPSAYGYRTQSADQNVDKTFNVIGGTSAASPVFAGVVALMNQKFNMRLGNINPTLYSLAGTASTAFHDITSGDNKVPCQTGTPDCPNGGSIGYSAAAGYDLASGLGSVDVGALVSAWSGTVTPDFSMAAAPASLSVARGTTGTSAISITAIGDFSGNVNLACSVSSTLGATTCSLSPTSIGPGQSSTLSILATSNATLGRFPFPWGLEMSFGIAALFSVPAAGARSRRSGLRLMGFSLLAVCMVAGMAACGGGGGNSSSGGNSVSPLNGSVTVTATSGSLSHSVNIPVTIN
jgi:subtilase family serine protease